MSRSRCHAWILASLTVLTGPAALGQAYDVLLPFEDILVSSNGWALPFLGAHTFKGSTAYAIVRGKIFDDPNDNDNDIWGSQITKIEHITGTPSTTLLVSNDEWKAFTGAGQFESILPGNRLTVQGDYLQYLDVVTDSIHRVHTTTGAQSVFVSTAGIQAVTSIGLANLIAATAVDTNGVMAFYEQNSDHILLAEVNSNGDMASNAQVTVLITNEELDELYGADPINNVAGGMTFTRNGDLYWTLSWTSSAPTVSGAIYKRDALDGSLSKVLEQLDIWLVTGVIQNVGFNDLYAAPDGNIYFYDRGSDGILYFDPADPVGTLAVYLTEAELTAGPAGTDLVGQLDSFGPYLAWNHGLSSLSPDIYAKPLADLPGDFDDDGDVDATDHAVLADCLSGPGLLPTPTIGEITATDCLETFDFDLDDDVDLQDFGSFSRFFTG